MNGRRIEIEYAVPGGDGARRKIDDIGAAGERTRRRIEGVGQSGRAAADGTNQFSKALADTARGMAALHGPVGTAASRFSAMDSAVGKAGAGLVAFGATLTSALALLGMSVKASISAEQQFLRIGQVLKTTGAVSGQTVQSIETIAVRIGDATLASTQEVRDAAAQLLTFKSISGDAFETTLSLAQDMADLGFGSVKSATVQLAKALEDPVRGLGSLREVGVSFTAEQEEMIRVMAETGRQAEAQAIIFKVLQEQIGGAGKGAAGGTAGALDTMTERWKVFLETIGKSSGVTSLIKQAAELSGIGVKTLTGTMEQGRTAAENYAFAQERAAAAMAELMDARAKYRVRGPGDERIRDLNALEQIHLRTLEDKLRVREAERDAIGATLEAERQAKDAAERAAAAERDRQRQEFEQRRDSGVADLEASLAKETELLRLNAAERERRLAADKAEETARRTIKGVTDEQIQALRAKAAAEADEQRAIAAGRQEEERRTKEREAAQRKIEEATEKLRQEVEAQDRLIDAHRRGSEAVEEAATINAVLAQTQEAGIELTREQSEEIETLTRRREEGRRTLKDMDEAEKEHNRTLEDGKRLTESMRTPAERYADEIARINRLLEEQAINQQTANRALEAAQKEFRRAEAEASSYGVSLGDLVKTITGGLVNAALSGGGINFETFLRGIGGRLAGNITDRIIETITGGGSSGGGLFDFSSLFSGVSRFFSGGNLGGSFVTDATNRFVLSDLGARLGLATQVGPAAGPVNLLPGPGFGQAVFTPAQEAQLIAGGWSGYGPTTAGSNFATAISQMTSLAVAPFLTMGIAALFQAISGMGKSAGPSFGATFDPTEDGLLGVRDVGTMKGFPRAEAEKVASGVADLANSFLAAIGAKAGSEAFRGEIGFTRGGFRTAVAAPGLVEERPDANVDATGIFGLRYDIRDFGDNANAAIADFISRSIIVGLRDGSIEGVSEEAGRTVQIGLGNIVRGLKDDFDDAALKTFAEDLPWLASFDAMVERFADAGLVFDAAADAEARRAAALEAQRKAIADGAASFAETALAGIEDTIDRAKRLFDPVGPDSFQIRLKLEDALGDLDQYAIDNPDWRMPGGFEPNADQDASLIGNAIFDDAGLERLGRSIELLNRSRELGDQTVTDIGALLASDGFRIFDVDFRRDPAAAGDDEPGSRNRFQVFDAEGRHVRDVDLSQGTGVDTQDLIAATRELVAALTEAGADYGDPVEDPFFAPDDRDRLAEAADVVRGQVATVLAELSGEAAAVEAPLKGFALLLEQGRANIEALRPKLQEVSDDLVAMGQAALDVEGHISAATQALLANLREDFVQSLDDILDPAAAQARAIEQQRADLIAQAEALGLGSDESVLERIDRVISAQLEQIGYSLDAAGNAVRGFAGEVQDAVSALDQQISAQRAAADRAAGVVSSLDQAIHALDQSAAGARAPGDQLDAFRMRMEDLLARARGGDEAAAQEFASLSTSYTQTAADMLGMTEEQARIANWTREALLGLRGTAQSEYQVALRQVEVLEDIRDRLLPANDNGGPSLQPVSYAAAGGGQYVATSGGVVGVGYDLGYDPEKALRILVALAAAGQALPSGFGEGQLNALRAANPAVDSVVRALGYAEGGRVTGGDAGRDSTLIAATPGERVYTVAQARQLDQIHASSASAPVMVAGLRQILDEEKRANALRARHLEEMRALRRDQAAWRREQRSALTAQADALRAAPVKAVGGL